MKKKVKILGTLLVVLFSIPFYYRNQETIDRKAEIAWNGIKDMWATEAAETTRLKQILSGNISKGRAMKSQREANYEAIKKSEEDIEKQLQKDNEGVDESKK
jgi:hypothetical protein